MPVIIDIHTHHNHKNLANRRTESTALSAAEVIRVYSRRMGVDEPVPERPYSEGIHPWDAASTAGKIDNLLGELAAADIVAVGEIGLDKLHPDFALQTAIFRQQLEVARRRKLPVIVHCVKAFEEVMKVLDESGFSTHKHRGHKFEDSSHSDTTHNHGNNSPSGVIFHGYTGNLIQTERVLMAGYYISAGSVSLGSPKTIASLRTVPLERLFLETDDSDLPIDEIYSRTAAILSIGIEELAAAIKENYRKVFLKAE